MWKVKAYTHRPIFRGVSESADSIPELADYTTDSVIVGRLPLSNMFNIFNPLEPTIGVGGRQIGPVGTGLKDSNNIIQ